MVKRKPARPDPFSANQYICPDGYGVGRFLDEAARAGFRSVGLCRAALDEMPATALARAVRARELRVTSLNSAGFFTWADAARRRAQGEINRALVDAAAELGAESLCVITGGMAEQPDIGTARALIADGLAALDAEAGAAKVRLGLEPIHPVGVATKGCVNTIAMARKAIAGLNATGLIVDLFHSWWDPELLPAIADPASRVRLVQVCNVDLTGAAPRRSPWLDRGALDMAQVLRAIREAGYAGPFEVEVFAADHGEPEVAAFLDAAQRWAGAAA